MRFVAIKSQTQQEVLALHRVRSLLIRERTALMNQIRGLLAECGIIVAQAAARLRRAVAEILGDHNESIGEILRNALAEMSERLRSFEQRLERYDQRIGKLARDDKRAGQLMKVPGVGPLTATDLIATVDHARQFKSGRELSAWLGLVPREHSNGECTMLLGISNREDRYLRTLLIHGARSALRHASNKRDRRSLWLQALRERRGPNIAAVALANKNARVLWALLARAEEYRDLSNLHKIVTKCTGSLMYSAWEIQRVCGGTSLPLERRRMEAATIVAPRVQPV